MMSPGQYLDHAMAAGHDADARPTPTRQARQILVEAELAQVQRTEKPNGRARGLDIEQTVDEQAYAAAMARFSLATHQQTSLVNGEGDQKWIVVGFKLDAESESYLRKLTRARDSTDGADLGR